MKKASKKIRRLSCLAYHCSSNIWLTYLLALCLLLTNSCTKDDDTPKGKTAGKEYRIAVVLPQKGAYWKNTIEWSLQNLNQALTELRDIKVTIEWFDESSKDDKDSENMESLFNNLAHREDIHAILGPLYSRNAEIAASQCYQTGKTLIPATVSSESIMRRYARNGFLWCLSENDISQCEILLTRALQKGARSVSLLTSDDIYGTTFLDWFAFQAHELGLTVHQVEQYSNQQKDLPTKMTRLLDEDTDCLICVPTNEAAVLRMNDCRRNRKSVRPFLLFSDVAYIIPKDGTFEGMEGITQTHDPQSGFPVAYEVKFGEAPGYGSAHYFDAVTLAGLAILDADLHGSNDLNASLRRVVDGTGEKINSSHEQGIYQAAKQLINGDTPHIDGASGKLYFDQTIYTNVTHSVYCHWQVYQGKHLILEYNTSDDSKRTNASMANWNWKVTKKQDIAAGNPIEYPVQEGLYALIIATSSKWENYRHQANAYAVYQLLKKNGLKDDHILLVSEDDIADNRNNFTPGIILSPTGNNLYQDIRVDYRPSEISLEELTGILSGETDASSPHPGPHDNLFVYWAGHGRPEGPEWLDQTIPTHKVTEFFKDLSAKQCYRRLFFAMETCYAGQIGICCEDNNVEKMLCLTAANPDETSKASLTDPTGQIWISNSFTDALLKQLEAGGKLSFYDLYHNTYNLTIGSHVSVYNQENFGNLYTTPIKEFLFPQSIP